MSRKLCVFALAGAALLALAGCAADKVDASLGARCVKAEDCEVRCLPAGPQFPGGMCSKDCLVDSDCSSEALCVPISGGVCLFSCRDDSDCSFLEESEGKKWTCQEQSMGTGPGKKVCLGPGQ